MKFLIVEDNEITVKGIVDDILDKGHTYKICAFDSFIKEESEYEPDIIILDWKDDAEDYDAGNPIFNKIISQQFVPTIIFSAIAETLNIPSEINMHPFVKVLSKGDEDDVIKCIDKWIPYIEAINAFRIHMNTSLKDSIKVLGTFMELGEKPNDDVINYMLNKRANQFFDDDTIGENPPAWIEYLYPPMKQHLMVADILRIISKETDVNAVGSPEEYAVILTPSCDMANSNEPIKVLLAMCVNKDEFCNLKLGNQSIDSGKGKEKVDRVSVMLNTGYNFSKVALPELPSIIPYLTLDLKSMTQVMSSEIALSKESINENHKYYRVASVNSPFREQIVWAHMINSCRPGMPNRDMQTWAKGILE